MINLVIPKSPPKFLEPDSKKEPKSSKKETCCDLAYTVDWRKEHPSRAGIIVYTSHRGKLYFALGLDALFRELTDFGGGVKYTKDGDAVNGALREFMEESLYSFGVLKKEDLQYSLVIHNEDMAIFFYYVQVDPREISAIFHQRIEVLTRAEVIDIVWVPLEELPKALQANKFYSKVSELLRSSGLFM